MTDSCSTHGTLPVLSEGPYAFFFDVDGTLATLQSRPEAVTIPAGVRGHLQQLAAQQQGALALVSGRPIAELDRLAAPLNAPLAGVHGAERRDAQGNLHVISLPAALVQTLEDQLTSTLAQWPGTQLECKGMAFALHYRRGMAYESQVMQLAEEVVSQFPELVLQPGKCVVEIKPQGVDKGEAIRAFMQESPFTGRIPVFIGDDLTDEKGFLAVNALQGVSIKVGAGSTHARYHLDSVEAVWAWLEGSLLQQQNNVGKEFSL